MSPGNRAIEMIFEALREEKRERESATDDGREMPEREKWDYVEHVPADMVPIVAGATSPRLT